MAHRLHQHPGRDQPLRTHLAAPDLPATITRAPADRDLNPATLTIEITEQLLLEDVERTRTVLQHLRHSGIQIALDDFGSGYSLLAQLRELPVTEIKLDRDFIAPILTNQRAAAIVAAVIAFAHTLGLSRRRRRRKPRHRRPPTHLHLRLGPGYHFSPQSPPSTRRHVHRPVQPRRRRQRGGPGDTGFA